MYLTISSLLLSSIFFFFFFNDTATTEIYTLSLHDALPISCRAAEALYIRAERVSLPSHASDMLSARLQAIGGTRTFTSQDSQPCRLLTNDAVVSIALPRMPYGGFSAVRLQGRFVRRGLPPRHITDRE